MRQGRPSPRTGKIDRLSPWLQCVAQVSAGKHVLEVHCWLFLDALHSMEEEGDICVGIEVVLKLRMLHFDFWLPKPTMV